VNKDSCREQAVYALHNRIGRFFNRGKNSRRVATRYDKLKALLGE
jgi:transposase